MVGDVITGEFFGFEVPRAIANGGMFDTCGEIGTAPSGRCHWLVVEPDDSSGLRPMGVSPPCWLIPLPPDTLLSALLECASNFGRFAASESLADAVRKRLLLERLE